MKVVMLGSLGGTQMCLGRVWVVTIYNCLVTYLDNTEMVSRIMEQAFGLVGIRPMIKVTAFDLNVLEAR